MSFFDDFIDYGRQASGYDWQKAKADADKAVDQLDPKIKYGETDWYNASPEDVTKLQESMVAQYGSGILPNFGVDGKFGPETATALQVMQQQNKNDLLTENKTGVTQSGDGYMTPVYGSPQWGFKKQWG